MRLFEQWLRELSASERVLDLGCGGGSFGPQLAGLRVVGVDIDPTMFVSDHPYAAKVCAEARALPFSETSFDLVISHHSLEHFRDAAAVIAEIRRVLKPSGRLFVSVPDGRSFSDRLYRLLFCRGGHLQQFTFQGVVCAVESGTGLHLVASKELFTSFTFLDKRNFTSNDRQTGRPLPRRIRWLGRLPAWLFSFVRLLLNVISRLLDRCLPTALSRYGWALAFASEQRTPETEIGSPNVCMSCGSGFDWPYIKPVARVLYRCPYCLTLNPLFKPPIQVIRAARSRGPKPSGQ